MSGLAENSTISRRRLAIGAAATSAAGVVRESPASMAQGIASSNASTAAFPLPAGATDCHCHIFDTARFPYAAERSYTPEEATLDDLRAFHASLGISRTVLVQPSVYGSDNRCLEYPDVELEELIVDATAALLIRTPDRFDVIVTTNMFGDILSDEASELSGSLGLGGSINLGDAICVAQAQHGSAPDIAGKNLANPTSLILSAAMLLDWRGRRDGNAKLVEAGALVEHAIERVLDNPATRTPDIGGTLGTDALSAAVIDAMGATHARSVAALARSCTGPESRLPA